jgi:hypothetical protein
LQQDEVMVVIGNILCSLCLLFKGLEIVNWLCDADWGYVLWFFFTGW